MQAIIHTISPFDAAVGTTIKFSWDGNQAFKNRCVIKNNDTQEVVYDVTVDSFKLEHRIDLEQATLINGIKYVAYITVFDNGDVESDIQSVGMPFLCLTTPTFRFANVIEGQNIGASAYKFQLEYDQADGELLNSWSITIYSKAQVELATSGIKYNTDDLSYISNGFSDKNEYFVRAIGSTINGLSLDTGYIGISVSYTTASVFSVLDLTNLYDSGAIHVRSNIVSAEGKTDKKPIYLDGEAIDLRDNTLTYDEGFIFDGDFSLVQYFYGMSANQSVIKIYGENPAVMWAEVVYRITRKNGTLKSYFELRIHSGKLDTVIYSNQLDLLTATDKVGICIVKQSNLYDIQCAKLADGQINTYGDIAGLTWTEAGKYTWIELQTLRV